MYDIGKKKRHAKIYVEKSKIDEYRKHLLDNGFIPPSRYTFNEFRNDELKVVIKREKFSLGYSVLFIKIDNDGKLMHCELEDIIKFLPREIQDDIIFNIDKYVKRKGNGF